MNGKDAEERESFVRSLDPTDRLVLMLHYAENLTCEEISLVLRLSLDVVERAMLRLRERAESIVHPGCAC